MVRTSKGDPVDLANIFSTACRNSMALTEHELGMLKGEVLPELVVPESPAASLVCKDTRKHRERSHELDKGPGQSVRSMSMSETDVKGTAAMDPSQQAGFTSRFTTPSKNPEDGHTPRQSSSPNNDFSIKTKPTAPRKWKTRPVVTHRSSLPIGKAYNSPSDPHNRLDEEIYGTTGPSTPAPSKVVLGSNDGLEPADERSRAVVNSLERELHLARTDKENIEQEHRQALQAKDREVKQVTETLRKLERRQQKEKRANETKIRKAQSDLDNMDERHTKALQEKELQLQQARDEIGKLKEQHSKALEEKETELQHTRAAMDQLREENEARNTNEQGHELADIRDEVAALKDRLALAERPDDEWIKYLPTTTNFYEAAPHIHPNVVAFDRDSKLKEIENRPSRKQTFGKRLSNVRKERGLYPHYLSEKQPAKEPSPARVAVTVVMSSGGGRVLEVEDQDSSVLCESSDESLSGNEKAMRVFDEMMAVPKNPIPCLVDNQLAWRDGTRVCTFDLSFALDRKADWKYV